MSNEDSPALRIAIVLPNSMAVRNLIETPVLGLLAEQENVDVTLLTPYEKDREPIARLGREHLRWTNVRRPLSDSSVAIPSGSPKTILLRWAYRLPLFWFRGLVGAGMLAYRFNHIHQFAGHRQKRRMRFKRKLREVSAGNYAFKFLGSPFPSSRTILRLLYSLYYSTWDSDREVEAFFNQANLDLLVISHPHPPVPRSFSIAARRRNLPILGIVGSWDRLTTKGPLCPGITRYMALNQIMRRELKQYHNVSDAQIDVVGWTQADFYRDSGLIRPRAQFLNSIGIPQDRRLIVFAANSKRLGLHEPDIIRHLANQVQCNAYGLPCTLLVRPHPKDLRWAKRWGTIHAPLPYVVFQDAETGRLGYLANLLKHADVMLSSQGSITLDAVGMDTCVVNVAFDGDQQVGYNESIKRWYELDHFLPVVQSGATTIVNSYEEMDKAVRAYLRNPNKHQVEREQLRRETLEPFDGHSSERLVELIIKEAQQNREQSAFSQSGGSKNGEGRDQVVA